VIEVHFHKSFRREFKCKKHSKKTKLKKTPGQRRRQADARGPIGAGQASGIFSFLYFLKIKISKIYVRFEIFQKYPPVAPP